MGNDGGSYARRTDLVKHPKKIEKVNQDDLDESKWYKCTLLQDELMDPIVTDDYGNLFNKQNVIQALLDGIFSNHSSLNHIRSTKSIYNVHFTENPSYKEKQSIQSKITTQSSTKNKISPWYCPITKAEVGGHQQKFVSLKPCGHVFSEKAIKEIASNQCLLCNKPYNSDSDIIILNPSPEELVEIKIKISNIKKSRDTSKKSSKKSSKQSSENREIKNESNPEQTATTESMTTSTTTTTSTKKRQSTEDSHSESHTKTAIDQAKDMANKKMRSDTFSSIFQSSKSINK